MRSSSDIFDFDNYKNYLRFKVDSSPIRGIVKTTAEAIRCQRSYLSQVMNGKVHITKDQAWALCAFWNLPEPESAFLMLLVEHARAGTGGYRIHLEEKISLARKQRNDLKSRVRREDVGLSSQDGGLYYSAWHWSAIHVLLSVPGHDTPEKISLRLNLPVLFVDRCLTRLAELGFAKKVYDRWHFLGKGVHVERESPLVNFHHANWRNRAVADAQLLDSRSIHFTNVQAVSREVFDQLRKNIIEFIESANQLSEPSPSEELICFNCDLFQV